LINCDFVTDKAIYDQSSADDVDDLLTSRSVGRGADPSSLHPRYRLAGSHLSSLKKTFYWRAWKPARLGWAL